MIWWITQIAAFTPQWLARKSPLECETTRYWNESVCSLAHPELWPPCDISFRKHQIEKLSILLLTSLWQTLWHHGSLVPRHSNKWRVEHRVGDSPQCMCPILCVIRMLQREDVSESVQHNRELQCGWPHPFLPVRGLLFVPSELPQTGLKRKGQKWEGKRECTHQEWNVCREIKSKGWENSRNKCLERSEGLTLGSSHGNVTEKWADWGKEEEKLNEVKHKSD